MRGVLDDGVWPDRDLCFSKRGQFGVIEAAMSTFTCNSGLFMHRILSCFFFQIITLLPSRG